MGSTMSKGTSADVIATTEDHPGGKVTVTTTKTSDNPIRWLTPSRRRWLYVVTAAIAAVLVSYGVADQNRVAPLVGLVAAILGLSTAGAHTDTIGGVVHTDVVREAEPSISLDPELPEDIANKIKKSMEYSMAAEASHPYAVSENDTEGSTESPQTGASNTVPQTAADSASGEQETADGEHLEATPDQPGVDVPSSTEGLTV